MNLPNYFFGLYPLANTEGTFSLNLDIFETGIVNIAILVAGVVYLGRGFLDDTLSQRQEKIIFAIRNSEEQLESAKQNLANVEKNFAQIESLVQEIEAESIRIAQQTKDSLIAQGKVDIARFSQNVESSVLNAELEVKQELKSRTVKVAFEQALLKFKQNLTLNMQVQLINQGIAQLETEI